MHPITTAFEYAPPYNVQMWFVAAATGSALVLALALWRVGIHRHRKSQNRSMRDHLNRISRVSE
jgi:hypothetical protein